MTRARYRGLKPLSLLEDRFPKLWRLAGGPKLKREDRFDPKRRYGGRLRPLRFIEVEGGI